MCSNFEASELEIVQSAFFAQSTIRVKSFRTKYILSTYLSKILFFLYIFLLVNRSKSVTNKLNSLLMRANRSGIGGDFLKQAKPCFGFHEFALGNKTRGTF